MRDYPFIRHTLPDLRAGIQALHQEIKDSQRSVQTFRDVADNYFDHIQGLNGTIARLTTAARNREAEMQTIQRESNMKEDTIRDFMEKVEAQDDYIQTLEVIRSKLHQNIEEKDAEIYHLQALVHTTQRDSMKKMAGMKTQIRELEAQIESNNSDGADHPDYESDENIPIVEPHLTDLESDLPDYESDEEVPVVQPSSATCINLSQTTNVEFDSNGSITSNDSASNFPDYEAECDEDSPITHPSSTMQIDLTAESSESESESGLEEGATSSRSSHLSDFDLPDYESEHEHPCSTSEGTTQSFDSEYDDGGSIDEVLIEAYDAFEAGQEYVKEESEGGADLYSAPPLREQSVNDWDSDREASRGIKRERKQYEVDDEDTEYEHGRGIKRWRY